jgi:dGTPase
MLLHLRFPVESSRGRRYPEPGHPYRNAFQRDRDRIIHTRAFRRLENKTQVFAPAVSDHFRNRLTHTIEVAQVARTVANVLGLNEDLTEALALVHDVGHPPFAHAGEEGLNRRMQQFGERFDHNIQALKIVESLEQRYPRFSGLNLTFEVREGIVKHSRDFEKGDFPELDGYLPGVRPPLEAQLIDMCDEIAYDTADLDDGYYAGLVSVEDVSGEVAKFAEFFDDVSGHFPGASERVRLYETVRMLINWLTTGLVEGTLAAAQGLASMDDVRKARPRVARFTPETAEVAATLKMFLRSRLYSSGKLAASRAAAAVRMEKLFHLLMEHPDYLPANYLEESAGQPVHMQVCDYIAGMTDGFFDWTCLQHHIL